MSFPPFLFRQAFAFPPNSRRLRSTLPFFRRATGVFVLCFLSFSPRQGSLCCIQMILQHREIKRGYLFRSSTCLSLPDLSVLPRPAEMGWVWCTWSAWDRCHCFWSFFLSRLQTYFEKLGVSSDFFFCEKSSRKKKHRFQGLFFVLLPLVFTAGIWPAVEGSLAFIRFGRAEQAHHPSNWRTNPHAVCVSV